MTYNQVQLLQINDYVNNYVDIEITGYRALYSKSIAGKGKAKLISWLGTAGPVNCFNKSLSDCYIRAYRFFNFYWQVTANFWLGLLLATPLKWRHSFIGRLQTTFGWAYSWLHPKTEALN